MPAEVCQVETGQPSETKLTGHQTRNMLQFAVRQPAQNATSIVTKGAQVLELGPSTNETLVSFYLIYVCFAPF